MKLFNKHKTQATDIPEVEVDFVAAKGSIQDPALDRMDAQISAIDEAIAQAVGEEDFSGAARLKAKRATLLQKRDKLEQSLRRRENMRIAKARKKNQKSFGKQVIDDDVDTSPIDFVRDADAPQILVPYEMLYKDGIMDLGNNKWSVSVAFNDTNYLFARTEDKEDILRTYQDWLNSHTEDEPFEFTFISSRADKKAFERDYALEYANEDNTGNIYRKELNEYISDKLTSSSASLRHERIVTFTCTADCHETAARRFAATLKSFDRFARKYKCTYKVLHGQARMNLLCSLTRPDDEVGKYTFGVTGSNPGLTTRDLVCPTRVFRPDVDKDDSRLVVGNRWVKSYTLLPTDGGWGSSMRDTLLSDLSGIAHNLVVSIHVAPWAPAHAVKVATRNYLDIVDENVSYRKRYSQPEKGFFIDETTMPRKMVEAQEGAEGARDELVSHRQRMFGVTIVVSAIAQDEQELDDACHAIEEVFAVHNKPGLESWVALREQSYTSMLPLGVCKIPYAYNMMTQPLSTLVPFMSADFQDKNGMLMGINADTNNLLLYSRTQRQHTNAMILGQPRGGKSVVAKLMQLQTYLSEPDADQIILDPEGEYVAGVERLGGEVVKISESSSDHINPLDISPYYASTEPTQQTNPISAKTSFIQSLISMMTHEITDEERNALDVACARAYEKWLDTRDDADTPTLGDLSKILREMDDHRAQAAQHLAELLYRFTEGTFSFFNHPTNVDVSSRLVDFSLVDMSKELKPLAMLILLDQIWVRVTKNRHEGRRTYLWVDEMQILIDDPHALRTLDIFWTRGRKWDLYNTAITQNIDRVANISETSYMMANSPLMILMKQSPDYATALAETFGLSDDQRDILVSSRAGEGIICIDNQPVHFDFEVDADLNPALYRFVTTNPDDLREERKLAHAQSKTKANVKGLDTDISNIPQQNSSWWDSVEDDLGE